MKKIIDIYKEIKMIKDIMIMVIVISIIASFLFISRSIQMEKNIASTLDFLIKENEIQREWLRRLNFSITKLEKTPEHNLGAATLN